MHIPFNKSARLKNQFKFFQEVLRSGVTLNRGLGAAATLFAPGFPVAECIKALGYFNDIAEPQLLNERDRALLIASVEGLGKVIPQVPLASRDLA